MIDWKVCKCKYCTKYGEFPILWEITSGVLWFEIPKNGSSTIKTTYKDRKLIKNMTEYRNFTPYVILRDPVDRFLSLFKHYFLEKERRFIRSQTFCRRLGVNVEKMDILTRLKFLLSNLEELTSDEEVHHFYPQTRFINTEVFEKFEIIKLDNLTHYLKVPVTNKTTNNIIDLSQSQRDLIKKIYSVDYDFFDAIRFNPLT